MKKSASAVLLGLLFISMLVLFQNCGSLLFTGAKTESKVSGTDTGNVLDRVSVADELSTAICAKASLCDSEVEMSQCLQLVTQQSGIPGLFGDPDLNTLEDAKTAELQNTVHVDASKALTCANSIHQQSCGSASITNLSPWITEDCSQVYSEP